MRATCRNAVAILAVTSLLGQQQPVPKPQASTSKAAPLSNNTRFDLTGVWTHAVQKDATLTITQTGNYVEARKRTGGTAFVPDGQIHFKGTYTGSTFPVQMQAAEQGFKNPHWINAACTVIDRNHISVKLGTGSTMYVRSEETPCPKAPQDIAAMHDEAQLFKLVTDYPACRAPVTESACKTLSGVDTASLAAEAPAVLVVLRVAVGILLSMKAHELVKAPANLGNGIATATKTCSPMAKPSKKSGKEKATDYPSWVVHYLPRPPNEDCDDFATRILNDKYGAGNWKQGANSEYSKIKKACQRGGL